MNAKLFIVLQQIVSEYGKDILNPKRVQTLMSQDMKG
jgi:hypothetical protein